MDLKKDEKLKIFYRNLLITRNRLIKKKKNIYFPMTIPAADMRNAASLLATPLLIARSGRYVKGMKRASVATPSARATKRYVERAGLSRRSLERKMDKRYLGHDSEFSWL